MMGVRRSVRRHAQLLALTICAAATGLVAGAAVVNAAAANGGDAPAPRLFTARGLMPGQSVTAHFTVTAVSYAVPARLEPTAPYLQAIDVRDGCTWRGCTPHGPKLSQQLRLRVTAANGMARTWTPSQLTNAQVLPGVASESDNTSYTVRLRLPARDTNNYANRTVNMDFRWGLMDANGKPLPRVLGESLRRTPPAGAGLPFTGADILAEVVAAVCFLAAGVVLVFGARRRRSRDMG